MVCVSSYLYQASSALEELCLTIVETLPKPQVRFKWCLICRQKQLLRNILEFLLEENTLNLGSMLRGAIRTNIKLILDKKQTLQFLWCLRIWGHISGVCNHLIGKSYVPLKYKMCSSSDERNLGSLWLFLSPWIILQLETRCIFLSLEVRTLYFVREDINNEKKKANRIVHVGLKIIFSLWCLGFLLKLLFDSSGRTFCPEVRQWELEKWHNVPYLSWCSISYRWTNFKTTLLRIKASGLDNIFH